MCAFEEFTDGVVFPFLFFRQQVGQWTVKIKSALLSIIPHFCLTCMLLDISLDLIIGSFAFSGGQIKLVRFQFNLNMLVIFEF